MIQGYTHCRNQIYIYIYIYGKNLNQHDQIQIDLMKLTKIGILPTKTMITGTPNNSIEPPVYGECSSLYSIHVVVYKIISGL